MSSSVRAVSPRPLEFGLRDSDGHPVSRLVVSLDGAFRFAQRHPTRAGPSLEGGSDFSALIAPDKEDKLYRKCNTETA